MQSFSLFFYHIRPALLHSFFTSFHSGFNDIHWQQPTELLVDNVQAVMNQLSLTDRLQLQNSIERIEKMVNDYSQRLLVESSDMKARDYLATLSSSRERACWVYLENMSVFSQAEAICQADYTRLDQYWSYYLAEPNQDKIACDGSTLKEFNHQLNQALRLFDEQVVTRVEERVCVDDVGVEQIETHFAIYHSQLPEQYLIFHEQEGMRSSSARLILQYMLIYSVSTGVIEVCAPDKSRRLILGHVFAHLFLQQKHIVLRPFTLLPLLRNPSFSWDSTDGIASVNIIRIRLQDSEWNSQLHIDLPPMLEGVCDIYQYMENYFNKDNPLTSDLFTPVNATIVIYFHHNNSSSPRKALPISIGLPNQCDLRYRTQEERALGEKYLKRWGLVEAA